MGKLQVNTAICDMTNATLEDLQKYEGININTSLLLIAKSTKGLLATGLIKINMATMIELEDRCEFCTINGGLEIGPDSAAPTKPTLLNVNGGLTIYPGSKNVIERYTQIIVNGGLILPNSIPNSNIMVNGRITRYPDEAVFLDDLEIDDSFINTSKAGSLYFVNGSLKDMDCDPMPLLEKKVSIIASNAIIRKEFETPLALIMQSCKNWEVIPSEFAYTRGIDLDSDIVNQYGKKLYVAGDLYITKENTQILDSLDSLIVTGRSIIPSAAIESFKVKCKKTNGLLTYTGEGWQISENNETLTKELLDDMDEGVTIFLTNSELTITSDITSEDILSKIHAIHGDDSILTIEQHQKIPLRKKVKGSVTLNISRENSEEEVAQANEEEEIPVNENFTCINTAYYKF